MRRKQFWFDTETTGKNEWKQDIIQLAGFIVIDDAIVDEFNWTCQPHKWDEIQDEALAVHGYGIEQLESFESPQIGRAHV